MFRLTTPFEQRFLLATVVLSVCLIGSSTYAEVLTSRHKLGPWAQDLKVGPRMDASGRILRGCVFVALDLRGANFDGADLGGCKLEQCDLRNASFKGAILTGLVWGECELEGADFTDAVINGYHGIPHSTSMVFLAGEQFVSTWNYKTKHLKDCVIGFRSKERGCWAKPELDFRNAQLNGALFGSMDFSKCDFTGATISGMTVLGGVIPFEKIAATESFACGSMPNVRFAGITVRDRWNLSGINLKGATFVGSGVLAGADLTNADISECQFRCSVTKEQLFSTRSYREGRFVKVGLSNQDLRDADFSAMNLTGCRFRNCDFTGASFENAVIADVDFGAHPSEGTQNLTLDQIKSTWNYKHGRMAGIRLPEELAKALAKEAEEKERKPGEGRAESKRENE